MRLAIASLGSLTLLATAACSDSTRGDSPPIATNVQLLRFADCGELEQYIEDTAVRDMAQSLRAILDYRKGGGGIVPPVLAEAGAAPNATRAASDSGASGPSAYTRTNTQVAGVDEADFVKTDGTHIYVIAGGKLHIAKSWPASELAMASSTELEGWPQEMFLDETEKRLVVLATVAGTDPEAGKGVAADCYAYRGWCGQVYAMTKVTVLDVKNPAAPVVKDQLYFPGYYQNTRRIGASVRLVTSDSFRWPADVRFYPDYEEGLWDDQGRLEQAIERLIVQNTDAIRARTLADWLPTPVRRTQDGALVNVAYDCRDFHRSNTPSHLGFTTVSTINLDNPGSLPGRTSVVAETSEIYSSTETLYLAQPHWWWWNAPGQVDYTYVHALDITDPNQVSYRGSGGFDGHILDQFSMDEHKGYLRVATTIARTVEDADNPWGRVETTNAVTVLARREGALVVVGRTPDLASGERIYSARFLGDRGFVVTFRQVDPLMTIDLSTPAAPKVVGELKVPGFSTYLHPLGEDHLLAIGVYQPDPGEGGRVDWQERRMKLSIFDVRDFARPKEVHTQLIGTAYGWSEAAYEHKAFNYFPERGLLAIPFSDYRMSSGGPYWDSFVSELRVFEVGAETGIRPKGAIDMKDLFVSSSDFGWRWDWSPWIRRSVMADDFVYAVSDAGIRVAQVDALAAPLATARFDRAR